MGQLLKQTKSGNNRIGSLSLTNSYNRICKENLISKKWQLHIQMKFWYWAGFLIVLLGLVLSCILLLSYIVNYVPWFSYAYGRFFHLKNSIWSSILTNVLFEDRFLSSNLVQWLFFFFKTSLILVLINYKVKPKGLNSNFLSLH